MEGMSWGSVLTYRRWARAVSAAVRQGGPPPRCPPRPRCGWAGEVPWAVSEVAASKRSSDAERRVMRGPRKGAAGICIALIGAKVGWDAGVGRRIERGTGGWVAG